MNPSPDLLIEFEQHPTGELMPRQWQLAGISYAILAFAYSFFMKYREFDLVRTMGISDVRSYLSISQLPVQLLIIIGSWLVFSLLASFMPINHHPYHQKLKAVSIILLIGIASVTAVIFTLNYVDVKDIVRSSKYY